jgi:Raf kinase inhibitor-like YbhB/YbcL family protein
VKTMRIRKIGTAIILLLVAAAASVQGARPQGQQAPAPQGPGLALTTTAFEDGSIIPLKYTQAVPNPISPRLQWTNVPANTVSYVLIFHDPDTAMQRKVDDVLHWLAFNIPGTSHELPEGIPPTPRLPDGTIQAKNTPGDVGYRGPGAAAAGPYHHYTFELYALDSKLDLGPDATRADVVKAMDGHILGKAVLEGRFHR